MPPHKSGCTWMAEQGGQGELRPKARVGDHVVRVGVAAPEFPRSVVLQRPEMERRVRFYERTLSSDEIADGADNDGLVARWELESGEDETVVDLTGNGHELAARARRTFRLTTTTRCGSDAAHRRRGILRGRWQHPPPKLPAGDESLTVHGLDGGSRPRGSEAREFATRSESRRGRRESGGPHPRRSGPLAADTEDDARSSARMTAHLPSTCLHIRWTIRGWRRCGLPASTSLTVATRWPSAPGTVTCGWSPD